ncbi:sulfur carrier protein ThiS [Flexivirga meconopsidis]|uniref:sulfur carrier protein ThiS n=1 Tax=Flexivirga meconopsidis TaxID=2977121 RepID=UPI00223F1732|nr:sulfur carrier protein ThiS [Flexivirga meconopsidis]
MADTFRLNGDARPLRPDTTVSTMLEQEGFDGAWFAVALDGAVVPSSAWAKTAVQPGAEVEIVRPAQGG